MTWLVLSELISHLIFRKLQTQDKKIKKELQGTRDLFGRLLYLPIVKRVRSKKGLANAVPSDSDFCPY